MPGAVLSRARNRLAKGEATSASWVLLRRRDAGLARERLPQLRILRLGRPDKVGVWGNCSRKLPPSIPVSSWPKIHLAQSKQIEGHEAS